MYYVPIGCMLLNFTALVGSGDVAFLPTLHNYSSTSVYGALACYLEVLLWWHSVFKTT